MSSIATFRLLETAKLPALQANAEIKVQKTWLSKKTIDTYHNWLQANSREVVDFHYSGHAFATLLPFLEEQKEINLWESERHDIADDVSQKRGDTTLILTYQHRQQYLDKLAPELVTQGELLAFNKEFAEEGDPALVEAEIAGIKALRDSLALLQDDTHVILLSIA
ncbi:hypothetical protein KK062_27450 [Fulvivirgaceae bacterium PWU5]|uniref:Uncharacterized protein n=1 Tax=Dawidia cretensis TaxID=2782350 RepID=A0AAP2E551_9BACT|nr:hypothetical protein [Dawidia cretensis]MBT1712009.1 hypothetical protein [Dawidia cretensis]